jgi:hypothetical protein
MANNRRKGHNAERHYAQIFRKIFPDREILTSRNASKALDDCKVDLWGLPLNVQVKAGKQKGLNESQVLTHMEEKLSKYFPERLNYLSLIIHKKDVGRGKKRTPQDELVTMTFEDFITLLNKVKHDL